MNKAQRIAATTAGAGVGVVAISVLVVVLIPSIVLRGDRICPEVRIAGVAVGGLTRADARRQLQTVIGNLPLSLQSPTRTWTVALSEVGGQPRWEEALDQAHAIGRAGNWIERVQALWATWREGQEIDLTFAFDDKTLRRFCWNLAGLINRAPRNGSLRLEDNTIVEIVDGTWGRRLNVDATVERIVHDYRRHHQIIPLVIEDKRPAVLAEDLGKINGMIGRFTTAFNPGKRNRTWNIHLAAQLLNGALIPPQQIFSFNRCTGSREADKGFKVAQIFVNKKIVDGVGGGVCQVSTTLYNAALQARLPIVERHRHSLPVPYIRSGRDATVTYPQRDLQFKNNTDSPVYIEARVVRGRLTVTLWGHRAGSDFRASVQLTSRSGQIIMALHTLSKSQLWSLRA